LPLAVALAVLVATAWGQAEDPKEEARLHAVWLEEHGKGAEAIKAYMRAARFGSELAARRLGEIYDKGLLGTKPDPAEALKWFNMARTLGEESQDSFGCPPKCPRTM